MGNFLENFITINPKDDKKQTVKQTPIVNVQPIPNVTPTVDTTDWTEWLKDLWEKRNLPGPDYYELIKSIKSLDNQPLPEQTKFISIFAAFVAQGVTKEKLIETANEYLAMFDTKLNEFKQAHQGATDKEIVTRQKRQAELEARQKALQEEMMKNANEIAQLNSEINDVGGKLNAKLQSFENMINNEKLMIQSNVQKINQYIQ